MVADAALNYLTRDVQYLQYDQLLLTVEDFCRATEICIGGLICVYSCEYIVPISLDIPRAELVL